MPAMTDDAFPASRSHEPNRTTPIEERRLSQIVMTAVRLLAKSVFAASTRAFAILLKGRFEMSPVSPPRTSRFFGGIRTDAGDCDAKIDSTQANHFTARNPR
jgi:hypothetical protein